jgi:hypothetical protein
VAFEIRIKDEFYATDLKGTTHTTLSKTEFDECTNYERFILCHLPRPIMTEKSQCYKAIHFMDDGGDDILKFCTFTKADQDQPRFLAIAPNKYAYYLPQPCSMHTTCPDPKESANYVTQLSRAGIFSYPNYCFANINNRMFYDTAVELVNLTSADEKSVLKFLQIARGPWPTLLPQINESAALLRAAIDNNHSESIPSINTRAKIYTMLTNLHQLGDEQVITKEFLHFFWNSAFALLVFIISNTALYVGYCCCFKHKRRHLPDLPLHRRHRSASAQVPQPTGCWRPRSNSLDNQSLPPAFRFGPKLNFSEEQQINSYAPAEPNFNILAHAQALGHRSAGDANNISTI